MRDDKIKESIQIAEELAKEICTGKDSTSLLMGKWKKQSPALYEEIRKQHDLSREISFHNTVDADKALEEIVKHIVFPAKRFPLFRAIGIAASFLLIIGSTALWLWINSPHEKEEAETVPRWAFTVPEVPKSSIITTDYKAIQLEESQLVVSGSQLVGTSQDGKRQIAIELMPDNQFNKLVVPAGGSYQLTLEDGTNIQVNAASELLFPTHFKSSIRQVKLKGEAYFKVKANSESPFNVLIGALNIQVTGTTFNIKAYEEGEDVRITLIEGKVEVRKGQQSLATLTPGQTFTYRRIQEEYGITDANIDVAISWTEERFIFQDETISNIMAELSRWYGVDIRVEENIKDLRYNGILSRKQPLTEILNALNMTKELDFKIHKDKKIEAIEKKNQ